MTHLEFSWNVNKSRRSSVERRFPCDEDFIICTQDCEQKKWVTENRKRYHLWIYMLLLNNFLKPFFWHLTLVYLQKIQHYITDLRDVQIGKQMHQGYAAQNLFFNGTSTQKPIDEYPLLLTIPPDPSSSLQESEHKRSCCLCFYMGVQCYTPCPSIHEIFAYLAILVRPWNICLFISWSCTPHKLT